MINEIELINHPVLNNILFDFRKETGSAYNTIVLVGENGVGKTSILETISDWLTFGPITNINHIKYSVNNNSFEITQIDESKSKNGYHNRINSDGSVKIIYNLANNIERDPDDLRYYGCVYSKSKTGFSTREITTTTSLELDSARFEKDSSDDYTEIKQLLIDINAQDNAEFVMLAKNNGDIKYQDFEPNSKMHRFNKAFNSFFDNISLNNIDVSHNKKTVTFNKDNKVIDIDNLSTGEKQIIFRGTNILKNINNTNNGVALIDEPELSMHPKWQEKIFQYYRNLFLDEDGKQKTQIIIATHSEYILKSALNDKNTLVLNLYNNNGKIDVRRIIGPFVLPTMTFAEINYYIFDVISTDYHIQLYGEIQTLINKERIIECDNYIENHHLYNQTEYEKVYSFGLTNYKTLPTYIRNCIDHPDSGHRYSEIELRKSIEFMIEIIKDIKGVV